MHGFSSGCSLLVNAEVDSMGGVIDSEDGIGTKTSPQLAAIQIAQAELRLEYDVREERRRELEFLEKGGNPLDFGFALAASLSIQSTSVADQINDQFVTSEPKGSFAVANSPRGDSVESNGILGATVPCEPNSADNFEGGNELVEREGRTIYPSRTSIAPSEHSSQVDGSQNVRDAEGSPSFQPNKAYRRRNRSKPNRDTARISSTSIASHGTPSPSLPSFPVVVSKAIVHEPLSDTEVDVANAVTTNPSNGCFSEGKTDVSTSRDLKGGLPNHNRNGDGVTDAITSQQLDSFMEREEKFPACSGSEKPDDNAVVKQSSESNRLHPDGKRLQSEDAVNNATLMSKGLDSDSSCTQTSFSAEANGNLDSHLCNSLKNSVSKGDGVEKKVHIEQTAMSKDVMDLDVKNVTCTTENTSRLNDNYRTFKDKSYHDKVEEEIENQSSQHEAKSQHKSEDKQPNQLTSTITEKNQGLSNPLVPESEPSLEKPQGPQDPSTDEPHKSTIPESVATELLRSAGNQAEVVDKAHEDWILEEAQSIEVKREKINQLSIVPLPKEYRRKSHWDFVLEEMAWMANDFAQERLWKRTTSSQLCQRAAFASRVKLEEQIKQRKDKTLAQTLARSVMKFWQSAGSRLVQTSISSGLEGCGEGKTKSENKCHYQKGNYVDEGLDEEPSGENIKLALQQYVARFLKQNSSVVSNVNTETFGTSEKELLMDMSEMTSLDQRIEEDLFYVVPHGAMEAYRKSIEIYTAQCEKAGKTMLEDADTSMNDSFAEFASQEMEYEEDEGESVYHFSGSYGGRKQPKFIQKRGRNPKSYIPKSYEMDRDFQYDHCMENRPQSVVGKRPPNGLNVGPIPTKRVRTASRQRVLGPTMGGAGFIPVPRRTDASSGDTNSFQDDQTTGSFIPRGLEVESRMDFDKQLTYDSTETTVKHKKKKKNKYQGEAYDRRWQGDANMQGEQKDHLKRRPEYHQYESSANGGALHGSHAKKLKITKHTMDNSFENANLMSGSGPSPAGSQMSNMSNQNKLMKLIGGRDRGRKAKTLKLPSGQAGSGSPWSLFEDQALVVLVHDMGPNWELVSDAINSTLYFKCIFRKPKECKERHKVLIEKSCADGADSADDSGCSQPYPSTLPGIPKGGARQLFQQLRGPIEEDTIKSHFEKIILLGQQLHGRKKQEPKQLVPVHGSHASALLQVIPNNVNGGVLTPLDLCDMASSSPDVFSLNYQSPHSGGLPLANPAISQQLHPSSGMNSLLQGPPGMGHPGNLPSPSGQLNSPASVGRYGVQRTTLPVNEQHRAQQYNHMLSARNNHQTNPTVSGAFSAGDRGLRVPPGGNGMAMPGMTRSLSIPRPNSQGISSSALLNSANSGSPSIQSLPMHSGASPSQGNLAAQPRDSLHMARAGQNSEHPRQIKPAELATQASSQAATSFGGPNSTFHNLQGPSSHPAPAEQQALAMRIARERQLQHRIMQRQQQQQQQQQFPHHPLQNGVQNSPVSTPQQQLKHLNSVGGAMNQGGKQRQRPPGQQSHPQSRHHPQPNPKGFGKGNMSMHQPQGETPSPASSAPTPNQNMLPSRNHQQLKVHPAKPVNNVQRSVSQNCVSEADQLAKRQYDQSRADLPLANTTPNSSLE